MARQLSPSQPGPVLIVGGYGLVGALIARRLRDRHPSLPLMIAGRSHEKASACATRLAPATGIDIDVSAADPLESIPFPPAMVVCAVNDSCDHLMMACVRRGIAFVDITRWSERVLSAVLTLSGRTTTAPVVLASGWMAGAVATATAAVAGAFSRVDTVMIDILFALSDAAGPDSLVAADRLTLPIPVWVDGEARAVRPLSDPRTVRFASGVRTRTWRYDTPDQITNVFVLGARRVESRINYDNPWPMRLLQPLLASGLWHLLETLGLASWRRTLLYSSGKGGRHEVQVEISGQSATGCPQLAVITLSDPQGQAHLTASGAVDQIERCLGLNGRARPPAGVSFPEHAIDAAVGVESLRQMGVSITLTTTPGSA